MAKFFDFFTIFSLSKIYAHKKLGNFSFFWYTPRFWPAPSDQHTTWRIVAPPDATAGLDIHGLASGRRVRHVFGLFFLSSPMIFSGLPDTHHYPITAPSIVPSTFTMLLHTSDDIEHMVGLLYVILLWWTGHHHTSPFRHNHQKSFMTQEIKSIECFWRRHLFHIYATTQKTGGDAQKRTYKLLSQIIYMFAFTFDLTSTVTAK